MVFCTDLNTPALVIVSALLSHHLNCGSDVIDRANKSGRKKPEDYGTWDLC